MGSAVGPVDQDLGQSNESTNDSDDRPLSNFLYSDAAREQQNALITAVKTVGPPLHYVKLLCDYVGTTLTQYVARNSEEKGKRRKFPKTRRPTAYELLELATVLKSYGVSSGYVNSAIKELIIEGQIRTMREVKQFDKEND